MTISIPKTLSQGDRIHVIAPSSSWSPICKTETEKDSQRRAIQRLESLGLKVSIGQHVWESGPFDCPSVQQRLDDLHQAFEDLESRRSLRSSVGGTQIRFCTA